MDHATFKRRFHDCQTAIGSSNADAVVLFPSPNLYYLTGFWADPDERHFMVFITADEHRAVVPELSAAQFHAETWFDPENAIVWSDEEDPQAALGRAIDDLAIGGGRLLVDDRMFATFVLDLRTVAPDCGIGMASEVLAPLRVTKDTTELSILREVSALTDRVSEDVRAMGESVIGLTETELATEIQERLGAAGGTGVSFEPIVGSGSNGARSHHTHGDRVIERGDPVILDFGTRLDRYPSDQTRTVVFAGDPPEEFKTAFGVVREAQQAGVDAVEPGVAAQTVDRAARSVIDAAGYGDAFIHRTGHGVGLDVHEAPDIVSGNETQLQPGMVFSVEPGIYIEGRFGIRIEDLVAVTDDGVERLNDTDRGWHPE